VFVLFSCSYYSFLFLFLFLYLFLYYCYYYYYHSYYHIIITITSSPPLQAGATFRTQLRPRCAAQTPDAGDPRPGAFLGPVPGKSRRTGHRGERLPAALAHSWLCPAVGTAGDWHQAPAGGRWGRARGRLVVQPQRGRVRPRGPEGGRRASAHGAIGVT